MVIWLYSSNDRSRDTPTLLLTYYLLKTIPTVFPSSILYRKTLHFQSNNRKAYKSFYKDQNCFFRKTRDNR